MSSTVDIITALGAAVTGTGGLKLIEMWLGRSGKKNDQDKQLRDELRSESSGLRAQIETLKEELRQTEKQMDEWKEKYWTIFMEFRMFVLEVHGILVKHGLDPEDVLKDTALSILKKEG